ncbi:SDR family NAD(P)-dependent oxidoreductase [Microbacterium pygmaeum]|uniref:2-deoxy-D-gluconate 3-dehydrogenase n=1 Tax=Microbacterium pygmaeum TaxID=370764 RepID=A0A1G7XEN2_9MICO|nr:glucose 1-dehydrogenase [Microbacterium pygmaeum]SDG82583.1 2-deoxy-D-gluconate 3-dehydrogenase [Microbacterium pygmaeum]
MNDELTGKVAIVTGAGRGLGRIIARTLSDAGANVVVASRTPAQLQEFVEDAEARGRSALAMPTDVTDEGAVDDLVSATVQRFGRVDILVNNSGVVDTSPLLEQAPAAWDRVIDTNLRGTYLVTRAVGAHLVAQGSGKVINIASNFALMGVANHAAYSASKAAVIAFTKSIAVEWARAGVQVNAIAPGYFETDLNAGMRADEEMTSRVLRAIPARRMGSPIELKPWILLLAGTASDFMTGEVIVIDGGQSVT